MAGHSLDLVQGRIYYFGTWEPNLTAFIGRRLSGEHGRTFVDVGANVGYFSLLAAERMPDGRIVAIEAFPSIYSKLEINIGLNKYRNIRTIHRAATSGECTVEMFHAGSANEGRTTSIPGYFRTAPVRVQGNSLSQLLTADEISTIRVVKIDVEGAEYSVVQGMRSMIGKIPDDAEIIMEISPQTFEHAELAETFSLFAAEGYFPYSVENDYSAAYYLSHPTISRPKRLRSQPIAMTDTIFSKIDAEYL